MVLSELAARSSVPWVYVNYANIDGLALSSRDRSTAHTKLILKFLFRTYKFFVSNTTCFIKMEKNQKIQKRNSVVRGGITGALKMHPPSL